MKLHPLIADMPLDAPDARLDDLDQDEFFVAVRELRPEIDREEYDLMWARYRVAMAERARRLAEWDLATGGLQ